MIPHFPQKVDEKRIYTKTTWKCVVNIPLVSVAIPAGHRRWSPPLTAMEEKTTPRDVRRGSSTRFIGEPSQS